MYIFMKWLWRWLTCVFSGRSRCKISVTMWVCASQWHWCKGHGHSTIHYVVHTRSTNKGHSCKDTLYSQSLLFLSLLLQWSSRFCDLFETQESLPKCDTNEPNCGAGRLPVTQEEALYNWIKIVNIQKRAFPSCLIFKVMLLNILWFSSQNNYTL